jgi:small subunit ribosomal protein S20
MPNTASAIRRVRRVVKQTSVNRLRKSKYRAAIKKMEELIKKGEKDKIKNFFKKNF